MVSTLVIKSWNDLKRRKSRTILTTIVIALGVIAMSLYAVIPMINQGIFDEIEESNMYDIRAPVNNLELNESDFNELEKLENVNTVDGKFLFYTRVYIGERRSNALIIGIDNFNDQGVDILSKESGNFPGYFETLTDSANSRRNIYHGDIGDFVKVYDFKGEISELKITGKGHILSYDQTGWGYPVFFTDLETVYTLSNGTGYTVLSFDLKDTSKIKTDKTIEEVRTYLQENTYFVAFVDLPEVREDGDYPGKEEFNNMGSFFYIITFVTIFCSFFLVANTMHTIVSEQRKEIAQMKAVGATKAQVIKSYLLTSLIMGAFGAMIGTIAGIFVAFSMASFLAYNFFGVILPLMVHPETLIIGYIVGVVLTLLATLPSLFLTLRVTVREGMGGAGITSNYGSSIIDKILIRMGKLPRSAQMGLRNVSRKKGRSGSTIALVAIAVGILLAVLSLGSSLGSTIETEFEYMTWDITATAQPEGGRPLNENMESIIEDIDGVAKTEPFVFSQIQYKDNVVYCFGYKADTITYQVDKTVSEGRWFNQEEEDNRARVLVIAETMSKEEGLHIGDTIKAFTASGEYEFKIIGYQISNMNHGMSAFIPITTLQDILKWNQTVSGFAIQTESSDHDSIDRTATIVEDKLMESGYLVNTEIKYVIMEMNEQFINMIMNLMIAVGSLVVLITMIGLMSTLTMNIIDRTKEIGMMRCIGSKSGHIRSMFSTEGLFLAISGWLFGIPVGLLLGQYLSNQMYELIKVNVYFIFPWEFVLISLIVTLAITILVIQPSLWKAARLKPGDALRYQ